MVEKLSSGLLWVCVREYVLSWGCTALGMLCHTTIGWTCSAAGGPAALGNLMACCVASGIGDGTSFCGAVLLGSARLDMVMLSCVALRGDAVYVVAP